MSGFGTWLLLGLVAGFMLVVMKGARKVAIGHRIEHDYPSAPKGLGRLAMIVLICWLFAQMISMTALHRGGFNLW